MAELSAKDAYAKKAYFEQKLYDVKAQIRNNFNEMDFANADKRDEMERCVEAMEQACDGLLGQLSGMTFQ